MGNYHFERYDEVELKMRILKDSISPLAAILLVADYTHPELEQAIGRLFYEDILRMDIRFNVLFQLLRNQKVKLYDLKDKQNSPLKVYDNELCDFKEVMKILDKTKGTVNSLIKKHKISPINHSKGEKRSFIREEIIKYRFGIQ
jgi:hypothetical protein